uniref:HMG box domain-containing protein n=1 Tax=Trieres chinensis TaxID=1514140 RepID=A0A7S1Z4C9_TRICV|mmetsp:Transcript_16926/g.34732  ORF Transcript_16926/g.34732 Transcript_16926/m.34732 type:complete len:212 (+) Transcript_16926:200-835(+)
MSSDEESVDSYDEEEESSEEEEEAPPPPPSPPKRKKGGKAKKDPNKPKRNMSAFFLYSNANRARIKEENAGIPFGQVAKVLSEEFKGLPAKERSKWDKKAEKDKQRYLEEMKHYVPPSEDSDSDDGPKKKQQKKAKDPNAPKRNQSSYFLYSKAIRPEVKEENPDASFGGIAKIISQQFKALPQSERAKWDKAAAQDKERYQRELAEYEGN